MSSDAPSPVPTSLDPLGALIYYLCVTEAIKGGSLDVPSSQTLSNMLKLNADKTKAINPQVDQLWNDLHWMNENRLLFHEGRLDDSKYLCSFTLRSLSSHHVNTRMNNFHPGFIRVKPKLRRIVPIEFVDRTVTAVRLVALKDLHHFNQQQVPQIVLSEFLRRQHLIADADEYYRFLQVMNRIRYIDFPDLPPGEKFSDSHRDKRYLLVEPSQIFRNQDIYLELRALDYFSEQRFNPRMRRMEIRSRAEKFASKNAHRGA